MKQLFTICLACLFSSNIKAQVKIGGTLTNADPSSILEIDGGNNKGLLLPRMRKLDMLAIPSPAEGLTVYLTDEQATYLRRQNNWVKLSAPADAFTLPYSGSFATAGPILSLSQSDNNNGSVAKFQITDAGSTGNVLEVTSNASAYSANEANGGYFKITGANAVGAAVKGEINSSFANVTAAAIYGINNGTGGVAGRFRSSNVAGQGDGVSASASGSGNGVTAHSNEGNGVEANSDYGYSLRAWKTNFATGTVAQFTCYNAANTSPMLRITNSGTGNAIQVEGINPQIQLRQDEVAKGFIQLNGDDLRLGTVADNPNGEIILRSGGVDRVFINSFGNMLVGGGAAPAGGHKVAIKGAIAATAFNVVALGSWPDYVFEKDYRLRSLQEIEAFIIANKHLPGIPSAAQVEKDGVELGDMQKRMMEKIEELTLHLIEADKKIKALTAKVEQPVL